jgi:hypothetical protein
MLNRLAFLLVLMAGSLFLYPTGTGKRNPQPVPTTSSLESTMPSVCPIRYCLDGTVLDLRTCRCVPFPPVI